MTFAVVFPGQGSQSVGMLGELAGALPVVRETFSAAGEVLGYDLWQVVSEGPDERLNATARTQPALLAAGIAVWRAWLERGGPQPVAFAGHSLGEYTALVAAGALDFEEAVALVEFRGRAMQDAVPTGAGAMAAILGLDDEAVRAACREAAAEGDIVEAANFNAPGQVVVAGHSLAVERAIEAAKARGAKRAVLLPVSVPSHCMLMRPAAAQLAERLQSVTIRTPERPVIHNVDAEAHNEPDAIRAALVAQLDQPVRWVDCVQRLREMGASRVFELGPGKVLTGLAKRIDRELEAAAVQDSTTLDNSLNKAE